MKDIIDILVSKIWLVLTITIVCTLVAAGFSLMLKDTYTCTSDLYVSEDYSEFIDITGYYSHFQVIANQQYANDAAQLVNSQEIQDAVCDDLGLSDLNEYKLSVKSSTKHRVVTVVLTGNSPEKVTDVMSSLISNLSSKVVELTGKDAVKAVGQIYTPSEPSGPNRLLIVALTFGVSFFITLVVLSIIALFDTTIKSVDDLETRYKVNVVAFP